MCCSVACVARNIAIYCLRRRFNMRTNMICVTKKIILEVSLNRVIYESRSWSCFLLNFKLTASAL